MLSGLTVFGEAPIRVELKPQVYWLPGRLLRSSTLSDPCVLIMRQRKTFYAHRFLLSGISLTDIDHLMMSLSATSAKSKSLTLAGG